MQVINIITMKSMIHHLGVGKRRPLYFWGPSGVGKSEGIQQACQEHDGVMCDIRVSQYEGIDFRGIPDVQERKTVWNMPATLPFKGNPKYEACDPSKPIFMFLDEINQGDPSVTSVCYQLIQDRRIGEHELLDNVVIIAAGNRDSDRGATNRWAYPLGNRGTHAELVADVKAWSVWAAATGKPASLIGFLNFRSELIHTFDSAKPTKVFATPRSWGFVAEDMEDPALPEDVRLASMSGSVGEGPAVELSGFLKIMASLRPIEEIIANPTKVPVSEELDVQWALATHVAGNMLKENADPLQKFLGRLEPEMVVMAWTLAINRDPDLTDTNAFLFDYSPKYRALFQN
jgi:hypothetical protein